MKDSVKLIFKWHGIKRIQAEDGFRTIPKADLYIDCRGIAEHNIPGTSGKSLEFQAGVKEQSEVTLGCIQTLIIESLRYIPRRRTGVADPFKEPYVVMFMCAHGQHRSVASAILMAERFKKLGYNVELGS